MKLYHHILTITALVLIATGCSTEEPAPDTSFGECELVVTLDTGTGYTPTRAEDDRPWGYPYPEEEGTPSENRVESVSLYFVTNSGTIITMVPTESSGSNGSYQYSTTINVTDSYVTKKTDGTYSISGRIVAVANYPGQLPANPFDMPAYDIERLYDSNLIPMWGISTVSDLTLRVNHTSDAGSVRLLRSVPKITIMLSEELATEYKISKVTSEDRGYQSSAYCQPKGALSASDTQMLMREGCFNPMVDPVGTAPNKFYGLGTERVWSYPAERRCLLSSESILSFIVTIERIDGTGIPFTGKVYLCDYAGGKPQFDTAFTGLVRNHDYQYKISLSELEFIISFKQWIFGGKVHLELE